MLQTCQAANNYQALEEALKQIKETFLDSNSCYKYHQSEIEEQESRLSDFLKAQIEQTIQAKIEQFNLKKKDISTASNQLIEAVKSSPNQPNLVKVEQSLADDAAMVTIKKVLKKAEKLIKDKNNSEIEQVLNEMLALKRDKSSHLKKAYSELKEEFEFSLAELQLRKGGPKPDDLKPPFPYWLVILLLVGLFGLIITGKRLLKKEPKIKKDGKE